jgi:hypothetical protein
MGNPVPIPAWDHCHMADQPQVAQSQNNNRILHQLLLSNIDLLEPHLL